jgi:hypothetical protein
MPSRAPVECAFAQHCSHAPLDDWLEHVAAAPPSADVVPLGPAPPLLVELAPTPPDDVEELPTPLSSFPALFEGPSVDVPERPPHPAARTR